jgi:hypothetical protein
MFWILGEQPIDDVNELIGVDLMWNRVMRIIDDCIDRITFDIRLEGEPKGAQLIGDHSDRPQILLRDICIFISFIQNFRGQILKSASNKFFSS